jgi:hypothetical protein
MSEKETIMTNTNKTNKVNAKAPKKTDPKAPKLLKITVTDENGKEWSTVYAQAKVFSSGSVGFYAGDKVTNPESGERYQFGSNITLIGSKPE